MMASFASGITRDQKRQSQLSTPKDTKHAIKQVDRMLGDDVIDIWETFARWVPHLVGVRKEIVLAMDWTEFDGDHQATLALKPGDRPRRRDAAALAVDVEGGGRLLRLIDLEGGANVGTGSRRACIFLYYGLACSETWP